MRDSEGAKCGLATYLSTLVLALLEVVKQVDGKGPGLVLPLGRQVRMQP